jgi:hypothetical protein
MSISTYKVAGCRWPVRDRREEEKRRRREEKRWPGASEKIEEKGGQWLVASCQCQ